MAGADTVGVPVVAGEPAGVGEAPPIGDGADALLARVGGLELAAGVLEPDPAQVGQRGGVEVPAEGELDRARGDERGGGDVGQGDVTVGLVLDEADRSPHRLGMGAMPVGARVLGVHGVGEDRQCRGGEQPGGLADDQRRGRGLGVRQQANHEPGCFPPLPGTATDRLRGRESPRRLRTARGCGGYRGEQGVRQDDGLHADLVGLDRARPAPAGAHERVAGLITGDGPASVDADAALEQRVDDETVIVAVVGEGELGGQRDVGRREVPRVHQAYRRPPVTVARNTQLQPAAEAPVDNLTHLSLVRTGKVGAPDQASPPPP